MGVSVEIQVLNKIKSTKRGTIFFVEGFLFAGNAKAVNKAMERLVKKGKISRVTTGMYTRPKKSTLLGDITPSIEEIASAIAKRDKARIVATGSYALNALGLSTQVPLKAVYLTDGAARTVKVGKRTIQFKKTTPKNLSAKGLISKLVIQALKEIGKDNINPEEERKINELLRHEKPEHLEHDILLAPEWIRKILRKVRYR
jgi:DNA-directed RNA polymerase subunit K/omega